MFKSLYSGVSGLGANLTNLDVIGNNIANSNTTGFKSGRVTFNEMLTQSIKSASRPVSGGLGGTNPQQVGLGTQVASIDTNFTQGNFQTTGKKTDLAIQGSGFFVLSDGSSRVYTRAGVFGLDSDNVLVNPSTGLRVQGVMADEAGVIGSGPLTDIFIDPGLVVPAQPSTEVQLMGNLDSDSDAKPTIMESPAFLVAAEASDLLVDMSGETEGPLSLHSEDVISVNGLVNGSPLTSDTYEVTAESTYQDLVDWLNSTITNVTFAIDGTTGALQVTNNGADDLEGFSLNCVSNYEFNENFAAINATGGTTIAAGTSGATQELRAFADATDTLATMYNATGEPLDIDLSSGSAILELGGSIGDTVRDTRQLTVTAATTMGDLMQEMEYALGINSNPGIVAENGQIVVTGEVGTVATIGDIDIAEQGRVNEALTSAFEFTQTQQATDQKTFSMATTIYDSLGGEHTLNFSFEKVAGENEWIWTASTDGNETLLSGQSGRIRFTENGSVSNFTFDDGSSAISIQPQQTGLEGAANITVNVDFGEVGALSGLTQFEGPGRSSPSPTATVPAAWSTSTSTRAA